LPLSVPDIAFSPTTYDKAGSGIGICLLGCLHATLLFLCGGIAAAAAALEWTQAAHITSLFAAL